MTHLYLQATLKLIYSLNNNGFLFNLIHYLIESYYLIHYYPETFISIY